MRILIIEDNKKTSDYISGRLKELAYAVDTAYDGKEGFYLSKLHAYDAIILDLSLPQKNGQAIISELRDEGSIIPIIVISGNIKEDVMSELFELGADDVVTKPFNAEELIARLQAILRRQDAPITSSLTYKNCTLDYGTQSLLINQTTIKLTRNEFALLEVLLQNPDRPVSRQEIFSHVWETDLPYTSNTVETHILNLRKKLAELNEVTIETVQGKGYKISSLVK